MSKIGLFCSLMLFLLLLDLHFAPQGSVCFTTTAILISDYFCLFSVSIWFYLYIEITYITSQAKYFSFYLYFFHLHHHLLGDSLLLIVWKICRKIKMNWKSAWVLQRSGLCSLSLFFADKHVYIFCFLLPQLFTALQNANAGNCHFLEKKKKGKHLWFLDP